MNDFHSYSTLEVRLHEDFYEKGRADTLFASLCALPFENLQVNIKGKSYTPKRKVFGFSDDGALDYHFSGTQVKGHPWTEEMLQVKRDVEEYTGHKFNYALINYYEDGFAKIGAHRDNERQLDPQTCIPTLSLGAVRTMKFSRTNFKSVNIGLGHGSLLVMQPSTNTLWTHEIPSEPAITQGRISITFRNIISPSVKRKSLEEDFEGSSADECCSMELDRIMNKKKKNTSTTSAFEVHTHITTDDRTLFKKDLGNNVYLVLALFRDKLCIHLREYYCDNHGEMQPSRTGVVFDRHTWYDFFKKLSYFNLIYSKSSFIANNNILMLNYKDYALVKSFNNNNQIKLNEFEITSLKEAVCEFNEYIIHYLLRERFAALIRRKSPVLCTLSLEQEYELERKLVACIENELQEIFPHFYVCVGCIADHPSQIQHPCLMSSALEKFEHLGTKILILLDVESIVNKFLETADKLSENFLQNISVNVITGIIFK